MGWSARIGSTAGLALAFLMRLAGLVTAIDLLLLRPNQATAPQVLLSGLLLLGGQGAKDLLLGLVDRLLTPHELERGREPADVQRERR